MPLCTITNAREIITLQLGQCGNQTALQYWSQLAQEHGLDSSGCPQAYQNKSLHYEGSQGADTTLVNERTDRPDVFFTYSDQNKYTPRSILVDLEPSVIGKCMNSLPMYNPRNIHLSENGTGAANNWKQGHTYASQHSEELLSLIDRELDKCDNLSAFQLFHSVAGGTGSGIGSHLMELLHDRYGSKKMISTFLVFPSSDKTSDVVVQPYNTMLTLKRLIDYSDATFVFDNDSLSSLDAHILSPTSGSESGTAFRGENKLIAYLACGVSNPLRFPSYMYSSYESIISLVVPTPDLKFLSSAIAPYSDIPGTTPRTSYVSLNENDIILELLGDKFKMNHIVEQPQYISIMNYLVGDHLSQPDIRKALLRAQQRVQFVPWASSAVQIVHAKKLPYSKSKGLSGYQISNNTSIVLLFTKIVRQYDLLAKRAAYINFYTDSDDATARLQVLEVFEECKETVISVIDEYKACATSSYLEDEFLDDMMS